MSALGWSITLGTPGALGALAALWLMLGFPTLATSGDIQRLDRKQTDVAIDIYRKNVRDSTILRSAVKGDPTAERLIDEDLKEARENLQRAQTRKIELSK